MYIFKKNMLCLYIKYMCIYNNINIQMYTCKYFQNIYMHVGVYLYIHTKYTQYTYIYY